MKSSRAALNFLGLDPDSNAPPRTLGAKAEELLLTVRPSVKKFHSSNTSTALANGDICLAVGWSGDILQARDRAAEADQWRHHRICHPEGRRAHVVRTTWRSPATPKNVEEAHEFLNYLMKAEVMAKASNYVYYANRATWPRRSFPE